MAGILNKIRKTREDDETIFNQPATQRSRRGNKKNKKGGTKEQVIAKPDQLTRENSIRQNSIRKGKKKSLQTGPLNAKMRKKTIVQKKQPVRHS